MLPPQPVNSNRREKIGVEFASFEYLQKVGCKDFVSLFGEMYAVIGKGNVPLAGIGKVHAKLLREIVTALGEYFGILDKLLRADLFSQSQRRWCNQ